MFCTKHVPLTTTCRYTPMNEVGPLFAHFSKAPFFKQKILLNLLVHLVRMLRWWEGKPLPCITLSSINLDSLTYSINFFIHCLFLLLPETTNLVGGLFQTPLKNMSQIGKNFLQIGVNRKEHMRKNTTINPHLFSPSTHSCAWPKS